MITLKLEDVIKKYNDNYALNGVTYNFKPGIYGLLGKNGAGKSTLIKIMTTIITDYQGRIKYNDEDINNDNYRKILGYMPQIQSLIPYMTVKRFLYYFASLKGIKNEDAKEKIKSLLIDLNLVDKQNAKISTLSGGMKQRVLLGQMLLNDPSVILLDEPTTGLDPVERSNFRSILHSISKDKIIIIATHIISDLEYICDEVIILKEGKVALSGKQSDVLQETSVSERVINENELSEFRDCHKVVNIISVKEGVQVRYLTEEKDDYSVRPNLDDVFIKWGQ